MSKKLDFTPQWFNQPTQKAPIALSSNGLISLKSNTPTAG